MKPQTKLSGFCGKVCWDCHITNQTLRVQGAKLLSYPVPDGIVHLEILREELNTVNKQITQALKAKSSIANTEFTKLTQVCEAKYQELQTHLLSLYAIEEKIEATLCKS